MSTLEHGHRHLAFSDVRLAAGDGVLQADGTLWSHAATLGTRIKNTEFTIDKKVVDNFIRVFSSGWPQKAPVDYEHGSTDEDPALVVARAQGKIPKAGDILEMQGVYGVGDFSGSLKTAAEKLTAAADPPRPLDDARNLGLWIRWRPTQRALQAIQAREYTELSIAFTDDCPHNSTGEGQGPAILAVALLNRPFLDDMLPVAASQRHGGSPAAPGNGDDRMSTPNVRILAAAAAIVGKAVTDEDQAITELTAFKPEADALRLYRADVGAAIGETDPAKAVTKVKELKAQVEKFQGEALTATKAKIDSQVEATLKKYEKRLTVPLKAMFATQLRAELEKGTEVEKTDAVKALESMPELKITGQAAGGDVGGANADPEVKLAARAEELMRTDPEIKELAVSRGRHAAYLAAAEKAEQEIASTITAQ